MHPGLFHLRRSADQRSFQTFVVQMTSLLLPTCMSDRFPMACREEEKPLFMEYKRHSLPISKAMVGRASPRGLGMEGVRLARLDFLKGTCGFHLVRGLA